MPSIVSRRKRSPISSSRERRFLTLLFVGIGIPFGLITAFVSADTRLDLSDLRFEAKNPEGVQVVAWPDLSLLEPSGGKQPADGAIVGVYGYMMDPHGPGASGSQIKTFTLMPDAGLMIHPAHRHPDQMVTIKLSPTASAKFLVRSLVFAKGRFEKVNALDPSEPLYILTDATVRSASTGELRSQLIR